MTGSCFIVEGPSGNLMVDCGMFQGPKNLEALNWEPLGYQPSDIGRMVLTHAHIDHSGLIPRVCRKGFGGEIYCTYATADLAAIMLMDAAHIQEQEAEWENRRRTRRGEDPRPPLYTELDAENCLGQFQGIAYDDWTDLGDGFRVRLRDAGHILGSAIAEVEVKDSGEWHRIVFSGDLGNIHPPILRERTNVEGGEVVLCESTYGSRIHEPPEEKKRLLAEIVNQAYDSRGNVIIPAFAIGRTQEIIYILNELLNEGKIPALPVYIDSPLAVSATEIFRRHAECFDEETKKLIASGQKALSFPGLKLTRSVEESKAINELDTSAIIISASGMCEAGRIKHHLKYNLYKRNAHIVFAGFQAIGTLGRRIRDGAKRVRIFGEKVVVRAKIHSIGAFSAHADREGLSSWLAAMERRPNLVCIVHGEDREAKSFAEYAHERLGLRTIVPSRGEEIDLSEPAGEIIVPPEMQVSDKGLIDEILQLDDRTSDLSGRLARLRDLLEARLINLDDKTADDLKRICQGIRSEAGDLLQVLDKLEIKEEDD